MVYQFTKDYFYPRESDGNISLNSQNKRITDAIQLLENNDDSLLIDGDIECHNEQELRDLLNG